MKKEEKNQNETTGVWKRFNGVTTTTNRIQRQQQQQQQNQRSKPRVKKT
jgi:hypothetical protein